MITILRQRNNGAECQPITDISDIPSAMESLIIYELGYGGNITSISSTEIVVETRVLSCYDTTTFSGNETDMRPLLGNLCIFFLN